MDFLTVGNACVVAQKALRNAPTRSNYIGVLPRLSLGGGKGNSRQARNNRQAIGLTDF